MAGSGFTDISSGVQVTYGGVVGSLLYQLDRAVADCAGKNSDLTMKLTFKRVGERVVVSGRLATKLRQRVEKPKPAFYFVSDEGLSADDPKQPALPFDDGSAIEVEAIGADDEPPWDAP